jgi:hypothetical protein
MAKFVQVIEWQSSKFDEMQAIIDEYRAKTAGKRTTAHVLVGKSRDADDRYVSIIEFPSYEDAMKNNELPETAEMAQKMQSLADAPPKFHNLDVVQEEHD